MRFVPPPGSSVAIALAEALANGTDEAVIVVEGDAVHAVRHGAPLAEALGLALHQVFEEPTAYLDEDELLELTAAWEQVASLPGAAHHAAFTMRDVRGRVVELEATATNLGHLAEGTVLVRLRLARFSHVPAPPSSDAAYVDEALVTKPQFMELLQRAVDRKLVRVWRAPTHARAVTKDRRCDFALVLVNLDRYGMLRGSFGEQELDNLIRMAAKRLRRALRARDAVGHLGGSELAIYLDGVTDAEQAARVVDAYTRILEDRFDLAGQNVTMAPVIGIATSERRYERADDVLQDAMAAASAALRRVRSGRQAYQTGIRKEDRRRLILSADLREGLDKGHVFEQYQPIVELDTGRLVGFEALCRWSHPSLALVGPNEFIPVAEETGLIHRLGARIMQRACAQIGAWNRGAGRAVTVSVNVSAAEIVNPSFARDVELVLSETGIAPECLVLEVTESALLEDLDAAKRNMQALRRRGVQFALDDFGTGYASLSYLVELPFNKLKLDRSLIAKLDEPHRRKVVRAVVALAHELGLEVVAEGIETPAQVGELAHTRCDLGQGYLYGAAMNVDEAAELLVAERHESIPTA